MKKTVITAALAVSLAFVVCSGQASAATMTSGDTDYTVTGNNTLTTTNKNTSATLTGTVTVENKITFAPSTEAGATYSNFWMSTSACGPISTSGTYLPPSVSGANITVSGEYDVRRMDFTGSTLTVTSTGHLRLESNINYYLSLGAVSVEAGGQLNGGHDVEHLSYTGAVNLALNSTTLTGTGAAYTTTALRGTMSETSSLTLDLTALTSFTGSSVTITLTDLDSSALATSESAFSVTGAEGWNVAVTTGDTSTVFTLSKPVPEPTTATLSLLALAGLAARRRRK